jgi:hypothetical protein
MIRVLALICCLAACSGGGGGGLPPVAPDAAFSALHDRVTAQGITHFAALPTEGAADYRGLVRLVLPLGSAAAAPYHGDLDLRIGFGAAADPVQGSIANLRGAAGSVTGMLQIGDGMLYPAAAPARDYQFSAALSGTLVQNGQSHDLSGALSGDFFGTSGQGIAGVIYRGMIRHGDEIDIFDGSFAADRSTR